MDARLKIAAAISVLTVITLIWIGIQTFVETNKEFDKGQRTQKLYAKYGLSVFLFLLPLGISMYFFYLGFIDSIIGLKFDNDMAVYIGAGLHLILSIVLVIINFNASENKINSLLQNSTFNENIHQQIKEIVFRQGVVGSLTIGPYVTLIIVTIVFGGALMIMS